MRGGVIILDYSTVLSGVGTFVSTVASNGVMFGLLIAVVACGVGKMAFGAVKRFLMK